jgi:hypothetical protein
MFKTKYTSRILRLFLRPANASTKGFAENIIRENLETFFHAKTALNGRLL